jgi:hypothetical protein
MGVTESSLKVTVKSGAGFCCHPGLVGDERIEETA